MSNDRRFQKQQRRARRQARRANQPAPPVKYPGVIGWFQANQRIFFVVGIVVMVLSLGGFALFGTGGHSGTDGTSDDAAGNVSDTATPTPTSTSTPEPDPTEEPDGIVRSYSAAPEFSIDPAHDFEAVIRTEKGEIRLELLPDVAPAYVNNFVFLARNQFYDGLTFHRVEADFVAQAGDPTATSQGGAGYTLEEELNELPLEGGVISMAKSSEGVSGSQFFITLDAAPHLDGLGFTVFGRVTEGMEVLRALTIRDPNVAGQPPGDRILSIEIVEQES